MKVEAKCLGEQRRHEEDEANGWGTYTQCESVCAHTCACVCDMNKAEGTMWRKKESQGSGEKKQEG